MKNKIVFIMLFCAAILYSFNSSGACPITGTNPICLTGGTSTLTVGGGGPGFSWGSSNVFVATATVSPGSGTTTVNPVAAGVTTITFYIFGVPQCTLLLTVHATPSAGTISGTLVLWPGALGAVTLTSSGDPGGAWTSSATSIATVGAASGVVTGIAVGSSTITYTVTNACGTAYTTTAVTVNPMPVVSANSCSQWGATINSTVLGMNTAIIQGNNTAQIYAYTYWDGSVAKFMVTDYGTTTNFGPYTLTGATNTPDIAIGNGTTADDYVIAVAYPTSTKVEVAYFDFMDDGVLPTAPTTSHIFSTTVTANTVHIDAIADYTVTTYSQPFIQYAVVTWDDVPNTDVYAAHLNLLATGPGALTTQLIDNGKDPDVAAVSRTSGPTDWALITYTNTANTALYYTEWDVTTTPSSPATMESLGGGSTVSIPRIEGIDDEAVNDPSGSDAVYKIVAEVYNSGTTYNEVRSYDNILAAGSPMYWTSTSVVAVPFSYVLPAPPYDHYAPTVAIMHNEYMVTHYTHVDAGSDVVFMEPVDIAASMALASPGDYYMASDNRLIDDVAGNYVSSASSPCNTMGGPGLVAWALPASVSTTDIWYKITPYIYYFKQGGPAGTATAGKKIWQVYPNPATGYLVISGGTGKGVYTITDMLGRVQMHGDLKTSQTIDIASLAPGRYILKLTGGDGKYGAEMFVKE